MSLIVLDPIVDKQRISSSNLIPIAKVPLVDSKPKKKFDYIYFNSDDVKGDTELEFSTDIIPVPYIDAKHKQRAAIFIAAPSGSGKSTLARSLILQLRELRKDPKRKVLILTSNEIPDPAFEDLKNLVTILFTEDAFLGLETDMLENYIVIADDWENFENKQMKDYVIRFLKKLLEQTRKIGVDIIIISHQIQQGLLTKPIIFECTDYYLSFASNKNACLKFLDSYLNLTKKELKQYESYRPKPFTFALFRKSVPMHSIVGNKISLL